MATKKNTKKTTKKSKKLPLNLWKTLSLFIVAILGCTGIGLVINQTDSGIEIRIDFADEPPMVAAQGEEPVYTVEEIDGGGQFKDITMGIKGEDAEVYYELGKIEEVDTSSPEAFKASVMGKCIIANNFYGAQCVSLARAFWWDYAHYDISTCGTGLAKGIMDCPEENARDSFKTIRNRDEIQDGTWIVLDGSITGHICMALEKPVGGYVRCLGENQGGISCGNGIGGSATNVINISLKNFIGGYTPLDYIQPEPEPEPVPITPDTGVNK